MPPPDSEDSRWFVEHVLPHEPMLRAWLHRRFERQVDIDDIRMTNESGQRPF